MVSNIRKRPYTMIIGGAGFIGQHLVPLFQHAGHYIHIIDPVKLYGGSNAIVDLREERQRRLELAERNSDVFTKQIAEAEYAYPDIIVYLAGVPRHAEVYRAPIDATESMVTELARALEIAASSGTNRFVYVSSSMVYGDFSAPVSEDAQPNPMGLYAILKRTGEEMVKDYARRGGFEYVIVRPTAVYGPGDLWNRVVPQFFLNAIANKELRVNGVDEVLDFTYVGDTARGIFLAATVDGAENDTYNISYGKTTRIHDVAEQVIDLVGGGSIHVTGRQVGFPSRNALDISRARSKLGYTPQTDLRTGLEQLHKWITFQTLSKSRSLA